MSQPIHSDRESPNSPARKERRRNASPVTGVLRDPNRGFALVVTLSMMILLTVVAVGLLSLSSITLRASNQGKAQQTAREHARIALLLAIGELQRYASQDQRLTATADIAGTSDGQFLAAGMQPGNDKSINGKSKGLSAVQPGTRYWTGVFTNQDTPDSIYTKTLSPQIVHWLMSGNTTTYTAANPTGGPRILPADATCAVGPKPVFQRLVLDQGFYPDGLWTAPSDEALKHDIELSMAHACTKRCSSPAFSTGPTNSGIWCGANIPTRVMATSARGFLPSSMNGTRFCCGIEVIRPSSGGAPSMRITRALANCNR